MLRQVSSRNQRGKGGLKPKSALQISLLVAICVWLIYQMNYSQYKKKAYEESDSKVSFKGDERQLSITKFSRKDLPHPVNIVDRLKPEEQEDDKKVEHGIKHDKVEDEEDTQEESEDETKDVDAFEDRDHEEAFHKAREISFRGDDASSEVAHMVQEVEHEEGSQEARERSFRADDVSSAVAHVPKVNEAESETVDGGLKKLDENGSKTADGRDGEARSVANETLEDSSSSKLLDNSQGNNSRIVSANVPAANMTSSKSENHKEQWQQPVPTIASIINNQTGRDAKNFTSFLMNRKNSTVVSVDRIETQANLMVKLDPINATVSQNQTSTERSIDGQANAVRLIIQKTDTVSGPEESQYENGTSVKLESSNSSNSLAADKTRDARRELSDWPDIQNIHSSKQETAEA
ncbi:hypothetical protein MUK42_33861 [Musa troglodytarum]|uniref:Uncharacterized protein n=1 Tax=Musa troglodytarum TaxID=320322 RepID=A0A9E7GAA5_9LILI|nr:hypothetical protein MUK42_33861 [Musa troglodytarum]URE07670.1 hypothetical protein MUK42_33861 [Musa troglodytarum]URE07671.1 hypothetical protein MUK42_33861 [Musa troglodytarum]URE07672.1 hypothetical protein MUK42_33861 [Musa troglodytarum]URE07673.1 hypothetical protein MUK42_33861 [Musa troglodytarum]